MSKTILETQTLEIEAAIFGEYLIHKIPDDIYVNRYIDINQKRIDKIDSNEKYLGYIVRHPRRLKYIDAYLALFRPEAELRHRLYIMFAILEANVDYVEDFVSTEHFPIYILNIAWHSVSAVLKLIIGILLVNLKGLN